jgi:hypothetical protein
MINSRHVLGFLGVLSVLRIVWVAIQGASPQEAYYMMCGERLAAAFYDGPPGAALLVRALGVVFGGSLDAVRMAWPLFGFLASWLAWLLVRAVSGAAVAAWTVAVLNALPVFNAHSVTVGPWMPALACVLGGLYFVQSAEEGRRADWLAAGCLFAIASLFRYEAVLVPAGIVISRLVLIKSSDRVDWLAIGALTAIPALSLWPALAWNARFDWIPLFGRTLQTYWRPEPGGWSAEALAYFGDFSFPCGLVLAFGGLFMLGRLLGSGVGGVRLYAWAAVLAVLWAWYQFLIGRPLSTAAWVAAVPVLAFLFSLAIRRRWLPVAGSALVVLALIPAVIELRRDANERGMWAAIATEIHAATREMPASEGGGFLIAETADQAAVLARYFKSSKPTAYPPVFVPESPALVSQFGIWPSYADFIESDEVVDEFFTEQKGFNPFVGRNALYVGTDLPQTIKGAFAEVRPIRKIHLPDRRSLTIHLCIDYQTLPL